MGILKRNNGAPAKTDFWARRGMSVVFRAEIMPGKLREDRTFKIQEVLPNGRVILEDFLGEHRQGAFEPINFKRDRANRDQNS